MRKLLLILFVCLIATSCRRDELPVVGQDGTLSVISSFDAGAALAGQNASTKATSTTFEAGDQVGIYMVDYVGSNPGKLKAKGNQADNVRYTSDATGLLTTNPPVRYTKGHTGRTDIYAYYPYNSQLTSTLDANAYEFSVSESQVAGISASDLCMTATTPTGVQPSSDPVELLFKHKLAKIVFTLNMPFEYKDGLKITGVSNFSFIGIDYSAKVNMGEQTVTTNTGKYYDRLTPRVVQQGAVVSETNNIPHIVEMIAPAQDFPAGKLLASIVIAFDNGEVKSFDCILVANVFGTDNKTVAGKVHNLVYGVKPGMELEFQGITIADWVDGPGKSDDLKQSVSTEFSVAQQPFAANFGTANRVKVTIDNGTVYDITTGVSVAGGVCKFKFTDASGSPLNYGFKITNLNFMSGSMSLYSCNMLSARVYSPTTMNLGMLPFDGSGTLAWPYLIGNAAQLDLVRTLPGGESVGKYFVQTADIDLAPHLAIQYKAGSVAAGGDGSTLAFEANGSRLLPHLGDATTGWVPLPGFSGSYNGNSYAISGVAVNSAAGVAGLVGELNASGMLNGVVLKNSYVAGTTNVGGIVGFADSKGIVADCHNLGGVVKGTENVAGVVGNLGTVVNCSNGATIYGTQNIGGVGGAISTYSSGLFNIGKVTGTATNVGGVIGVCAAVSGQLYGGYNRGNVTGAAATTAGAVVGNKVASATSVLDGGYWLSTATYTNCGPNGYGTASVTTNITNFAAMTAADMQNANVKDPLSLLYKLNQSGGKWVIAPSGHYNAGWPIPSTLGYVAGYYNGVVPAAGATVDVPIIAPDGVAWTLTSPYAAQAAIIIGSGTGRGTASVQVNAHAGPARTLVLTVTSGGITNFVRIKQEGVTEVTIAGTKWTTANLTGSKQGDIAGFAVAANPQDYGMYWKWGSKFMYDRTSGALPSGHWDAGELSWDIWAATAPTTRTDGYDFGSSSFASSYGAPIGDPCQSLGANYKTPTHAQLMALHDATPASVLVTLKPDGVDQGVGGRLFGPHGTVEHETITTIPASCIFLPIPGIRLYKDGSLYHVGNHSLYMSSTAYAMQCRVLCLGGTGAINVRGAANRGEGHSVRCVQA